MTYGLYRCLRLQVQYRDTHVGGPQLWAHPLIAVLRCSLSQYYVVVTS